MKAIGSSSAYFNIYVRGMETPIKMSEAGGAKLAAYLEGQPGAFVHIKDVAENEHTIRVMTIDRVQKYEPHRSAYKTVDEMRMPDLVGKDYEERIWK